MKNKKKLYLMIAAVLLVAFCISGCNDDDTNSAESPPTLKNAAITDEPAAVIFVDPPMPGEWPVDPVTIKSADIEGDLLHLTVSYGGGCKDHEFNLLAGNYFLESYPVQVDVILSHNANGDACESLIAAEPLAFDLSPLKDSYLRAYPNDPDGEIVVGIRFHDNQDNMDESPHLELDYSFEKLTL